MAVKMYLTLREERRLRVFENRIRDDYLSPNGMRMFVERKRLHNQEIYSFYHSRNIVRDIKSRRLRWAGH